MSDEIFLPTEKEGEQPIDESDDVSSYSSSFSSTSSSSQQNGFEAFQTKSVNNPDESIHRPAENYQNVEPFLRATHTKVIGPHDLEDTFRSGSCFWLDKDCCDVTCGAANLLRQSHILPVQRQQSLYERDTSSSASMSREMRASQPRDPPPPPNETICSFGHKHKC